MNYFLATSNYSFYSLSYCIALLFADQIQREPKEREERAKIRMLLMLFRAGEVSQKATMQTTVFFCKKISIWRKLKNHSCRIVRNKNEFLANIRSYATELSDFEMLQRIEDELKIDAKMAYHNDCQLKYFAKYQSLMRKTESTEGANKVALEQIIKFVREKVIDNKRMLLMEFLELYYIQLLKKWYEVEDVQCKNLTTQNIKKYIQTQFKNEIQFKILFKKLYVMASDFELEFMDDNEIEDIIFEQEAVMFALKYRERILKIKTKPLQDILDSDALEKGECDIPDWLLSFWRTTLGGFDDKYGRNENLERLASTYAQDSIYGIHNGKIKPRKHIMGNFDPFSKTSSGLHNTVRIIYQYIQREDNFKILNFCESENQQNVAANIRDKNGRKKRLYEPEALEDFEERVIRL